ncbi:MAG: TIGR00282 family metallophosphoesterase [Candidatus Buchananbacteria bacterium]|nr:TIGR00282 family metallophosphoesterase [Candidatus Buchananbacteria bacterium]
MRILFFGDVVGKIARRALKIALPDLKSQFEPDVIIANIENVAHGTGITEKTKQELKEIGIDYFTSGDHIFDKPEIGELINKKDFDLIRPANYPKNDPGQGYKIVEVGTRKLMIVNLSGQVFMKRECGNPFTAIDEIIKQAEKQNAAIIVDLHAEATSEKIAFGLYVDGRVAAVVGTHTHVPTADAKILPKGTAYVTDLGMVGAVDSVLGMTKEISIQRFLNQETRLERIPETGAVEIGAAIIDIDPKEKIAKKIVKLDKIVEVL